MDFQEKKTSGTISKLTRRSALVAVGAGAGMWATRKLGASLPDMTGVPLQDGAPPVGFLNDASGMSMTPVHKHIHMQEDPGTRIVALLRAELAEARSEGRPVNLAAARHSMGGQSIPRNGHAVTFDTGRIELGDETYRAHAGARWHTVIAALDPAGRSPKVMQSNNDFGVAASFSVNAHGWPTAFGPMGSTVRSIGLLLADGTHITASRDQEPDLFAAAMGGYGLIGLITDLEIESVPNTNVSPNFQEVPAEDFAAPFQATARSHPMAFGRLNVDRAEFFQWASLVSFDEVEGPVGPPEGSPFLYSLVRRLFRAQEGNDWVKRRRWDLETRFAPLVMGPSSRSAQMNKSVAQINGVNQATKSDILHEYFVPPESFAAFIAESREIILNSYQDLLNVTLRWVERDQESLLSYAPNGPQIALVMNFGQERSSRAEADATVMTRRLIDAALTLGGSYYLPYRPHAMQHQFENCYRRVEEFVAFKRRFDPSLTFRNALWDNYLSHI